MKEEEEEEEKSFWLFLQVICWICYLELRFRLETIPGTGSRSLGKGISWVNTALGGRAPLEFPGLPHRHADQGPFEALMAAQICKSTTGFCNPEGGWGCFPPTDRAGRSHRSHGEGRLVTSELAQCAGRFWLDPGSHVSPPQRRGSVILPPELAAR